jgi:hypothetical protein
VPLLLLTLAWKSSVGLEDSKELPSKLIEFLVQHEFDVIATEENMDDMPILRATRGPCSMLVLKTSPYGWRQHMISDLATTTGRAFTVFRGRVYTEQPTWQTLATHLWSRFLRELGLLRHTTPVIAVVAPAACDGERLPWDKLRETGVL